MKAREQEAIYQGSYLAPAAPSVSQRHRLSGNVSPLKKYLALLLCSSQRQGQSHSFFTSVKESPTAAVLLDKESNQTLFP